MTNGTVCNQTNLWIVFYYRSEQAVKGMPARFHHIPIILLAGIILFVTPIARGDVTSERQTKPIGQSNGNNNATKSQPDLTTATNAYKVSIETLIPIHENALKSATEKAETLSRLYTQGLVSRRDLEAGEQAVKDAQRTLDEARQQLRESAQLIAEIKARPGLKSPASRGYAATSAVMRSNGSARWSLTLVSKVKDFFASAFRRELPISALGQTGTHNRMGFDHRNSVDVALHPDSTEGKALIDFLRRSGIPFIAFRAAVPGAATGAHIHIGYPSSKMP